MRALYEYGDGAMAMASLDPENTRSPSSPSSREINRLSKLSSFNQCDRFSPCSGVLLSRLILNTVN